MKSVLQGLAVTSAWSYFYNQPFRKFFSSVYADDDCRNTIQRDCKWIDNWDFNSNKHTRQIYLIRHGNYVHGTGKLNSVGRSQATLVGERFVELNIIPTHIFVSPVTRAQETNAKMREAGFMPNMDRITDNLLAERTVYTTDPNNLNSFDPRSETSGMKQVEAAFRKHFVGVEDTKMNTTEVYVCHANIIRYLVCRLLRLPLQSWMRMSINNGSSTWITIYPGGRVMLNGFSDTGNLTSDMLETSYTKKD